jgi:hypothetical protein
MTSEEASRERDRARQEASERADKERNQSLKERAQAVKERNAERKQERNAATNALTSGTANIKLAEIARQGGPVGRRLEREIRQFQQTGRVGGWLAGETIKAEAAQNAAQQSAFRQQAIDVISRPATQMQVGPTNSYVPPLSAKPEIKESGGVGGAVTPHPFKITSIQDSFNENLHNVTVTAGTLNNLLPTNLFSNNALRKFTISSNQLYYVILNGETNGSDQFNSCSISVSDSPPPVQTPTMFSLPTSPQFLLGVVFNGASYNTIINSLLLTGEQQFIEEKSSPVAGALPYNIYYVWA